MKKQWLQRIAAIAVLTTTMVPLQITSTFAQSSATVRPAITVTTAPTVASVYAINDHQVSVTFSRTMEPTSVEAGIYAYVGVSPINANVAPDPTDHTGKRFIVSFPADDNLYATSITRNLTLEFDNSISDTYGNMLVLTNKYVTVRKDTTLPVISSITNTKYPDGSLATLVLNLSKASKAVDAGNLVTSGIKIINSSTGVDATSQFTLSNDAVADGDKKITFSFADNPSQPIYGNYKFYLPAGLVIDNTQGNGNSSRATTLTANFGTYVNTFKITQDNVSFDPTTRTIQVNFNRKVTSSAVVASNYMVGGKTLPYNTWISLDSTQEVATITLPAGFETADNLAATFRVANVRDLTNTALTAFTGTVQVYDSTAPTLRSALVASSTQIVLTYSENMAQTFAGDAANEFIITNNGKYVGMATPSAAVGYKNEVVLTLDTPLDLRYGVTVKTVALSSGAQIVDGSLGANDQVGGTLITATIKH